MATTKSRRNGADRSATRRAREALDPLAETATRIEGRLADAAGATEAGVRAANDDLRQRSNLSLGLLGAFSVGLTTGLLLAGAHRLAVAASLIPAALISGVILERLDRPGAGDEATRPDR